MLLKPKTFRKYHEADDTHAASKEASSTPRCNIGLKRNVSGKGTFVVTNPENIQLIHPTKNKNGQVIKSNQELIAVSGVLPPMTTIGRTLIKFPLTKSDNIADEFGVTGGLFWVLK